VDHACGAFVHAVRPTQFDDSSHHKISCRICGSTDLALERGTPTSDKQLLKIECDDTEYRRFANVAPLNFEHARLSRKRARPSTFGNTGQLAAQPTSKYSGTTQSGGSKKKTQQSEIVVVLEAVHIALNLLVRPEVLRSASTILLLHIKIACI
jgi:hypothetical protein